MSIKATWLGLIGYRDAYLLQMKCWQDRSSGLIPDTILVLEHPPVFTIGKSGRQENILVSQEQLAKEGISLFFTDRGGDVTYHGPGQLVVYPIIDLRNRGRDLHRFVFDLEEAIIQTLKDFGICGQRDDSHPGVWADQEEIAAIGLSVKKWITFHGVALNVNTRLEHFALINPCGFTDRKATSMAKMLSHEISLDEVRSKLITHLSEVFQVTITWRSDTLKSEDQR